MVQNIGQTVAYSAGTTGRPLPTATSTVRSAHAEPEHWTCDKGCGFTAKRRQFHVCVVVDDSPVLHSPASGTPISLPSAEYEQASFAASVEPPREAVDVSAEISGSRTYAADDVLDMATRLGQLANAAQTALNALCEGITNVIKEIES